MCSCVCCGRGGSSVCMSAGACRGQRDQIPGASITDGYQSSDVGGTLGTEVRPSTKAGCALNH